jgi:hypothetical protein
MRLNRQRTFPAVFILLSVRAYRVGVFRADPASCPAADSGDHFSQMLMLVSTLLLLSTFSQGRFVPHVPWRMTGAAGLLRAKI